MVDRSSCGQRIETRRRAAINRDTLHDVLDDVVTTGAVDLQPCRRLAVAILMRAVTDLHDPQPALAAEAAAWLSSESDPLLALWTTLAGLDQAIVRARARAALRPVYREVMRTRGGRTPTSTDDAPAGG